MNRTPSKLFHAVVISGAALTACAGPASTRTGTSTNAASTTSTEAANTSTKATPDSASKGGTCPPGSERPYPPCYWIK
ncbi:MAG: hypothetical protein WKG01_15595 [Kofleriaceae bacterium]